MTPPDDDGPRRPSFDPPWEDSSRRKKRRKWSPSDAEVPDFKDMGPRARFAAIVAGLLAVMVLLLVFTGNLGIARVEANQVAVRVNYLSGTEEVITQPGYQFYLPFVTEVYKLDRQTQEFVMEGESYVGVGMAPELTVRAKDGSNFSFKDMDIQYEIIPSSADVVLRDSGPGENFKKEWIKAYARSILRDEFGKYSAVEVADPTTYKSAPGAARDAMNEILRDHGIQVVQIITPNPRFDPKYEDLIEKRKEADQKVLELKAEYQQLIQQKSQRLAAVAKEKDVEMEELQGNLVRDLREAEREAIRLKRSADAYATTREAEGQAQEAAKTAEAGGLVAKYTKEAEGIQSRAEALEQRGEVVVREALVEKLRRVSFTFVPYSRDPAPERLEHSGNVQGSGAPERMVPAESGGGER